jgi:hypothetical protein
MSKDFVCAACGEPFTSDRDDEEAKRTAYELFGPLNPEDFVVICEDCFQRLYGD